MTKDEVMATVEILDSFITHIVTQLHQPVNCHLPLERQLWPPIPTQLFDAIKAKPPSKSHTRIYSKSNTKYPNFPYFPTLLTTQTTPNLPNPPKTSYTTLPFTNPPQTHYPTSPTLLTSHLIPNTPNFPTLTTPTSHITLHLPPPKYQTTPTAPKSPILINH